MAELSSSAFGIYSDRVSTERAIDALRAAGFRLTDISALFPDEIHTRTFCPEKRTKMLRGAVVGAGSGAIVGGLAGWLASIDALVALGPMVASVISLAACGIIGTLVGGWIGRRFPQHEERYENRVRRGDILVAVQCDSSHRARKARDILRRTGGDGVSSNYRIKLDMVHSNRQVIRPVVEVTIAPPLRLVPNKSLEPESETPQPAVEARKKSAVS